MDQIQQQITSVSETDPLSAEETASRHPSDGRGRRRTVLTLIGWPRDEATGPVQSLLALALSLSSDFNFKVLAFENADSHYHETVSADVWENYKGVERYLCSSRLGGARLNLIRVLRRTQHDVLLLNGFFDREFSIPALLLRKLSFVPSRPTIVSPRGEFSAGALGLKSGRKRSAISLIHRLGLLSDVWLHATCAEEEEDIRRTLPFVRRVFIAPNLRTLQPLPSEKTTGEASSTRIAFLSRIDRMKNLNYAINVLSTVRFPIAFDIYGPVSQPDFWEECQRQIERLPSHISVRYRGAIPNSEVMLTLAAYDLFFLPTLGENFGHAIFDALEAGTPVLISDKTPWTDLERHEAGWSLPLSRPSAFADVIHSFAAMSAADRLRLRRGARRAAERYVNESAASHRYRQIFRQLIAEDAGERQDVAHP